MLIGQIASSHAAVQMLILLADSRHDLSRRQPLLRLRALASSRAAKCKGVHWFNFTINTSVSSVHRLEAGEQLASLACLAMIQPTVSFVGVEKELNNACLVVV